MMGPISSLCNHNRAVDFYAESVVNEKAFVAYPARSYKKFKKGKISNYPKGTNIINMGLKCSELYDFKMSKLII